MTEKVIIYRKEKSISFNDKTGEVHFHKLTYNVQELKEAVNIIETKKLLEEANNG